MNEWGDQRKTRSGGKRGENLERKGGRDFFILFIVMFETNEKDTRFSSLDDSKSLEDLHVQDESEGSIRVTGNFFVLFFARMISKKMKESETRGEEKEKETNRCEIVSDRI